VVAAQHLVREPPDSEAGLQRWRYRVVAAQRVRGFAVGCPLGSLAAELLGAPTTDGATRAELDAAFRGWRGLLASGLRRGADTGGLPADLDADAGAESLVVAVQGGSVLAALADAPAPLQAALDRAIAELLAE
jgi:TetR/AcrR family transcriptional regulator, transcriptional repressor for nem operon